MTERRFKYSWSRTWADRVYDFSAMNDERRVGRVYRLPGPIEHWSRSMYAPLGDSVGSKSSVAGTRDEACDAVETAYEDMKARNPAG